MKFGKQGLSLLVVLLAATFVLGAYQSTPLAPEDRKVFRDVSD